MYRNRLEIFKTREDGGSLDSAEQVLESYCQNMEVEIDRYLYASNVFIEKEEELLEANTDLSRNLEGRTGAMQKWQEYVNVIKSRPQDPTVPPNLSLNRPIPYSARTHVDPSFDFREQIENSQVNPSPKKPKKGKKKKKKKLKYVKSTKSSRDPIIPNEPTREANFSEASKDMKNLKREFDIKTVPNMSLVSTVRNRFIATILEEAVELLDHLRTKTMILLQMYIDVKVASGGDASSLDLLMHGHTKGNGGQNVIKGILYYVYYGESDSKESLVIDFIKTIPASIQLFNSRVYWKWDF